MLHRGIDRPCFTLRQIVIARFRESRGPVRVGPKRTAAKGERTVSHGSDRITRRPDGDSSPALPRPPIPPTSPTRPRPSPHIATLAPRLRFACAASVPTREHPRPGRPETHRDCRQEAASTGRHSPLIGTDSRPEAAVSRRLLAIACPSPRAGALSPAHKAPSSQLLRIWPGYSADHRWCSATPRAGAGAARVPLFASAATPRCLHSLPPTQGPFLEAAAAPSAPLPLRQADHCVFPAQERQQDQGLAEERSDRTRPFHGSTAAGRARIRSPRRLEGGGMTWT